MKLYLNHTERYPVEQLQMQLFASEPSEFVTAPFAKGENGAVSNLFTGNTYVTATAKITWNGKTGSAAKRLLREQADVRHTRSILQQSYYLAAMQVLDAVPPHGARSPASARASCRQRRCSRARRAVRPSASWSANFS